MSRGDVTTVRLSIKGRVQGVWYRGWAVGKAEEFGLTGWVRNVTDGSVEVLVNGPKDTVDQFTKACWSGPPAARVDDIDAAVIDSPGRGGAFPSKEFQQIATFDPAEMPEMN